MLRSFILISAPKPRNFHLIPTKCERQVRLHAKQDKIRYNKAEETASFIANEISFLEEKKRNNQPFVPSCKMCKKIILREKVHRKIMTHQRSLKCVQNLHLIVIRIISSCIRVSIKVEEQCRFLSRAQRTTILIAYRVHKRPVDNEFGGRRSGAARAIILATAAIDRIRFGLRTRD